MSFWSSYHENGIIPNLWKGFTGQLSAEIQNEKNLDFQREQFDYQKQLNQLQMEREDTAYQRAAVDAQRVGINPMALAGGNGASSSPLSSTSFSGSSLQGSSPADGLAVITNLIGGISRLKSESSERDLLKSQEDKQNLDNAITAYDAGFEKSSDGSWIPSESVQRNQRFWDDTKERLDTLEEKRRTTQNANEYSTYERNERVNQFQKDTGLNDETTNLVKNLRDIEKLLADGATPEAKSKIHDKIESVINFLKKVNKGEEGWNTLQGIVDSEDDRKAKDIKKNHANYYNRMIRGFYEQGNSK